MERDTRNKQDLPEGFAARTIARLLEQGRRDRLYMRMGDARALQGSAGGVPGSSQALMELGRTYDPIEGPSQDEAATLRRAAQAAPESIEVALVFTAVQGDREKQTAAIEKCLDLCRRRLEKDPDNLVALTAKAQMLLWKGDSRRWRKLPAMRSPWLPKTSSA